MPGTVSVSRMSVKLTKIGRKTIWSVKVRVHQWFKAHYKDTFIVDAPGSNLIMGKDISRDYQSH